MMKPLRTKNCGYCKKAILPGRGYSPWSWTWDVFCGPSCYEGYKHTFGKYYYPHLVPDPRYHRLGDGWRYVKKWVNAALPMNHQHKAKKRREKRGQSKPR